MKIIKQLKKASMSNNKKDKKALAKKIDKKILKALKKRYLKAKKEMLEAEKAYNLAKDFSKKNNKSKVEKKKPTSKKKKVKDLKPKKPVTKKPIVLKKPKSNAKVTTLSELEPTPKKAIKKLPKQLRIKKTKPTVAKPKKPSKTQKSKVKSKKTPTKPQSKKAAVKPIAKTIMTKPAPKKVVALPTPKSVVKTTRKATPKPSITKKQMEDLKVVEGVGPAIERLLKSKGINTVADLSKSRIGVLRTILEEAGSRFRIHKPDTWARQARLAANGKWDELKELQKALDGGKKK